MTTLSIKLTDQEIKRQQKTVDVSELNDPGTELRLRFRKDRTKATWYIVHRGQWHWVGYWPTIPVKKMREFLPEKILLLNKDPEAHVAEDKQATMEQLITWFIDNCERDNSLKPKTKTNIRSLLNTHVLPKVGHLDIVELTPKAFNENVMVPLKQTHQVSTCKAVFGRVKTMLSTAKAVQEISINPLSDLKFQNVVKGKVKPRGGKLHLENISTLLQTLSTAVGIDQLFAVLVLLCGTRIGETRVAQRNHINKLSGIWRIPGVLTKTGAEHAIPLSTIAITVIEAIEAHHQQNQYTGRFLFPSAQGKDRRCWNEVEANQSIQTVSGRLWTCRDLRNLARTAFEKTSGDWATSERLLNHSLGKLDETYVDEAALWSLKTGVIIGYHDWLISHGLNDLIHEIIQRYPNYTFSANAADLAA